MNFLIATIAYFLGSIPSGLLISRFFALEDPRTRDSKNIGATNVLRSGHKVAAFFTLIADTAKGSLSVILALLFSPSFAPLAGIIAILGHIFPIWLKFKGGKGIATAFGVILIFSWPLAVLCLITWITFFLATRYSSLASLIAVLSAPLYALILKEPTLLRVGIVVAILIVWTHRRNIERLLKREEHHIDTLKPPKSS